MRLAIFGGTFDPIHNAHLAVARQAVERFQLDRVLFVVSANPPHKAGERIEPFLHRLRMVELACLGQPEFTPSSLEEGTTKSYSIDTIEKVRKTLLPSDRLYFLIGADAFAEIQTWHRWKDVIASVEFIVAARPGHQLSCPEGAVVHPLETLALAVSSSAIRSQLARGEAPSEVPATVLAYIRGEHLYQ